MLSSVDLPQPEWPMMETYSPFSMLTVMPRQHLRLLRAAGEGFVDVVDLQVGHVRLLQLAAVPRVTMLAIRATIRSSTKPMTPM